MRPFSLQIDIYGQIHMLDIKLVSFPKIYNEFIFKQLAAQPHSSITGEIAKVYCPHTSPSLMLRDTHCGVSTPYLLDSFLRVVE